MSEHFLPFSARAGFVCSFQSPWEVSALVGVLSAHLTTRLAVLFSGDLDCPSGPCDDRGSNIFGGTASFCPEESDFCILFFSYHDREGLDRILIVTKVPNFIWGPPKLSEGLLPNSERRPGKSTNFLLFSLSRDGEYVNGFLPFSLKGFMV